MKYKIIGITGKSASGKDRLLKGIKLFNPFDLNIIVPTTSRPRRDCEVDGEDYYFVSEDKFKNLMVKDAFLEVTVHRDWWYGVQVAALDSTKVNVGVFNPIALHLLSQRNDVDLKIFCLEANDKIRLLRQLSREENPDCHEIVRRFGTDEEDFSNFFLPRTTLPSNNEQDYESNLYNITAAARCMHLQGKND